MGIAFTREASAESGWSSTVVVRVNVTAGDLIVVMTQTNIATRYLNGVADDGINSYNLLTLAQASTSATARIAWAIASGTLADNDITATFSDSTNCTVIVAVFTPDSGDTVTVDDEGAYFNDWDSTPWQTASIDVTGTDVVVCAVFGTQEAETFSNHEYPSGTSATSLTSAKNRAAALYRITTDSGLAEVDISLTNAQASCIAAFKSTASGGTGLAGSITGVSVVAAFQPYIYRTMINDVVTGQSNVPTVLPYTYHTLINDVVAAQSNVPTILPYVYHTLINNVVTGLSNIPTLLPYVYHTGK
jgi:hypothetical protein